MNGSLTRHLLMMISAIQRLGSFCLRFVPVYNSMETRERKRNDDESDTQSQSKRRRIDINWDHYVSATSTRNYFLNDPL